MGMTNAEDQKKSYVKDSPHGIFINDCGGKFHDLSSILSFGDFETAWGINVADFNNDGTKFILNLFLFFYYYHILGHEDISMFGSTTLKPYLYSNPGR